MINLKILEKESCFKTIMSILIFVFSFGHICSGQVTIEMNEATVKEVIEEIENTTEYRYLYNSSTIDLKRIVSISVKDGRIREVLAQQFEGTNIQAILLDQQIILKVINNDDSNDDNNDQSFQNLNSEFKEKEISGRITNKENKGLIGVTLLNISTGDGVTTDVEGNFTMKATDGDVVEVSYLGYDDFELIVSSSIIYNIVLEQADITLSEVQVVSTGYEKISKERATGSFEFVSTKTLDTKISQNIISELSGEVAGLLYTGVQANDDPGIIIRGLSSINANTQPLIVVDGFPIEGSFKGINPNDVKSISVLKDAAAASIWGIRAANGVIVIETKGGKRNKGLAIDFSTNLSVIPEPDLYDNILASPEVQLEYLEDIYNAIGEDFVDVYNGTNLNGNNIWKVNPVLEIMSLRDKGAISSEEYDAELARLSQFDIREDLLKYVYQPSTNQQYNLAFSGGGDNNDFRVSFIHNRNQGQVQGTGFEDYTINMTNTLDIGKKLQLRSSINSYISNRNLQLVDPPSTVTFNEFGRNNDFFIDYSPENLLPALSFYQQILDENGEYTAMDYGGGASQLASDAALELGYKYPWTYNFKEELDNNNNTINNNETRIQLGLNYDILKSLQLSASYQYEWGNSSRRNLMNENRFYSRNMSNRFTVIPSNGTVTHNLPLGSIVDFQEGSLSSHTFRTQANYNQKINEVHQITALAGYEVRKIINESRSNRLYGYNDQSLTFVQPDYSRPLATSAFYYDFPGLVPDNAEITFLENRFLSYFANAAYTYNYKYTISASTRLDDTNLFGVSDDTRNRPLYSIGFKWNASQEQFFKSKTISNLVLRATYGTNGNFANSTSPFLQTSFETSRSVYNNGVGYIVSLPNPQLRLEKTRTINLGLEVGLWNDRLRAEIDVYRKDSEDLLASQAINSTLGAANVQVNVGDVRNTGIEAKLSYEVIKGENLQYRTQGIFSYNKNEVIKADDNITDLFFYFVGNPVIEGQPLDLVFAYQYAGLDSDGAPQYIDENNEIVDFKKQISTVDALVSMGTRTPPMFGSWVNEISYKNWSLRTLAIFQFGHVRRRSNVYTPGNIFDAVNVPQEFADRWRAPGDENITDIPRFANGLGDSNAPGFDNYQFIDQYVYNASTVRLQEVILSYNVNPQKLAKLNISALQFTFQVNNLKVWNFNEWDIDQPDYELLRIRPNYQMGLNVSF